MQIYSAYENRGYLILRIVLFYHPVNPCPVRRCTYQTAHLAPTDPPTAPSADRPRIPVPEDIRYRSVTTM